MLFNIYVCVHTLPVGFVCKSRHVMEVQRSPQIRHPGCETVLCSRGRCHGELRWRDHHLEDGDTRTSATSAEAETERVREIKQK